jgi:hypothetical protein
MKIRIHETIILSADLYGCKHSLSQGRKRIISVLKECAEDKT